MNKYKACVDRVLRKIRQFADAKAILVSLVKLTVGLMKALHLWLFLVVLKPQKFVNPQRLFS